MEFKETFAVLDTDGDGYIDKEDLRDMLASLGQAPTDQYVESMLADSPTGHINFATFLTMMANKLSGTDSELDILSAFASLDEDGEGIINADVLREALTTMGDRLTDDEVDVMFQGVTLDSSNNFDYREFVKVLKHGRVE